MKRILPVALLAVLALPLTAQVKNPGTTAPKAKAGAAKTVWPDEGPRTWAPRPTKPAVDANDLRTRLYQIADDSMMGREAGTLGSYKTTEYIAKELTRLGLKPAGENGTFFQDVPFGPTGYDVKISELIADGRKLTPIVEWVPMAPSAVNGISNRMNAAATATVFGGRWGDTTALDAAAVAGKVVVFLPALPAAPAAPPAGGGGRGGVATVRDQRAQKAGAVAVLVAGLDAMSEAQRINAFTLRIGLKPANPGDIAGVPAANISMAAAEGLLGGPLAQLKVGAAGKSVSGKWLSEWTMSKTPGRNVIAMLPGSDPKLKDEYVLIGAHTDHVGMVGGKPPEHDSLRAYNRIMRPQGANDPAGRPTPEQWSQINALVAKARAVRPARPDTVNNGADDDGSGTAVLLEIAEHFATEPAPGRSMIFNFHIGEEKGLVGSKWFVDHPTVPLDKIVAAHNMDMLGKGRVTDVRYGGPASVQMLGSRRLSDDFGHVIDSLNAVRSEPMVIDYSWDRTNLLRRFCRSDQVSYFDKQIPVTYFSLGYAVDYHMPTDEPQYIDYEHGARVGRFVAEIARTVANRPERLQVLPLEKRDLSSSCGR
ncbi:MAG: M28 family peptidase [Gemmatimonadales bacterium]|nr:M28 family peptidase [Gemmatimonadales bacterium]